MERTATLVATGLDDCDEIVVWTSERPVTATTLLEVIARRYEIRTLKITSASASGSAADALRRLMAKAMPGLDELEIFIDANGWEPGFMTLDFPPQNFDCLRNLSLRGVIPVLSYPTLSQLSTLLLEGQPGAAQAPGGAIILDYLGSFHCLEELTIRNFVGNTGVLMQPVVGPDPKTHLGGVKLSVVVEDDPAALPHILARLHLADNSNVSFISNIPYEPSYSTIVGLLPIRRLSLQECTTQLEVSCVGDMLSIRATTSSDGAFSLKIPMCYPTSSSVHGLFNQVLLAAKDMFNRSEVEKLSFMGNLGDVPSTTWASVLADFPDIRHLKLEDPSLLGSLRPLLPVLMTTGSPSPDGIICDQLVNLTLRCASEGTFLEDVCQCIRWRQNRSEGDGFPRKMDKIHIRALWPVSQAAQYIDYYRNELARYATDVILEAVPAA